MQKMNFANMTGLSGNLAAAELLWSKRSGIMSGKISGQELAPGGEFGEGSIRTLAKDQTSVYSKSTAQIENAYIEDAVKGIGLMSEKMTGLFGKMMDGVAVYIDEKMKGLLHQTNSNTPTKNVVHRAVPGGSAGTSSSW